MTVLLFLTDSFLFAIFDIVWFALWKFKNKKCSDICEFVDDNVFVKDLSILILAWRIVWNILEKGGHGFYCKVLYRLFDKLNDGAKAVFPFFILGIEQKRQDTHKIIYHILKHIRLDVLFLFFVFFNVLLSLWIMTETVLLPYLFLNFVYVGCLAFLSLKFWLFYQTLRIQVFQRRNSSDDHFILKNRIKQEQNPFVVELKLVVIKVPYWLLLCLLSWTHITMWGLLGMHHNLL